MANGPIILWFTRDLRLRDHPALQAAARNGPVIPLFILQDQDTVRWPLGGASKWWLARSLRSLARDLKEKGSRLILRRGDPAAILAALAQETGAAAVYWSRAYEPDLIRAQEDARGALEKAGIAVKRFGGRILFEPETISTQEGSPYKVFTPFYKALLARGDPSEPLSALDTLPAPVAWPESDTLESWALEPTKPDWAGGLRATWTPGEAGARDRLAWFLDEAAADYDEMRDRPDIDGTSRMSPHLTWGEISPRQIWHGAKPHAEGSAQKGIESFLSEVVWREFSYHLLFHWPALPDTSWREEFREFPWDENEQALRAWQCGRTGYPIVDAAMRQLYEIGWMHNRCRMITASFLIKDLLIPWQRGEEWFWDTLVDADLASNSAGWQWAAGSGADAAPYFRIFNPVKQAERFDPEGAYVREYVPELAGMPAKHIHAPWEAPSKILRDAGVHLGETYPEPIVDHGKARKRALAAFQQIKRGN
ncbi:cryptochrome/photolyase family protein [Dichotomicrobium thermohalophilum]|uniref:Deoxyribodipyrimidine photo-lyase n=1 Tax=Dichotomicrobium thermohalophilum TaxID=933063 RepID=A0A397Q421_9HYPH|nr:deoxyribodipyrimidine photo-lyase [Dichotomicrobium thermohalophilum]RIA55159.1 deoxyribodipyrimidine photo-lyase [Dichotomicrobium thermohalophilum]